MQKDWILSPSLLSCDFGKLGQELRDLENAGIKWIHWDVMDGAFVPNITMGPPIIEKSRNKTQLFFDVHLMIEKPERYIQQFAQAGADLLSVHAEATPHLESVLSQIQKHNLKPAIALNPHTPICQIEYLLPQVYMVLIMGVNPGFEGQSFINFSLDKVRDLAHKIKEKKTKTLVQVDGGVDLENAGALIQNGADVLVSGSAFFKYPPYAERLKTFEKVVADF